MYAVSPRFLDVVHSGNMVSAARVITSTGVTLSVEDGSVDMDSRRGITRTCSLTITPTATQSLAQLFALLMTPDLELTVSRGLLVDGVVEYVPLGVFSTDSVEYSVGVAGSLSWTGSDRSKKISRSRFTDPYQINAGTTLADAGVNLLLSRWSLVNWDFSNVTETVDAKIIFDAGEATDPWECARKLFSDHGYDLNFDGNGTARAVNVQDPASVTPVFDFSSGATSMLLDATIRGTLEQTYNGVIATGEGTNISAPVRYEAWDDDPNSPTYFQGQFGRVPYFYSSPLLTTAARAQRAAQRLLFRVKGRAQGFSFPAVVHPALEPLDVISVTINGATSRAVIDKLSVPLRPGDAMTAVMRETSVV